MRSGSPQPAHSLRPTVLVALGVGLVALLVWAGLGLGSGVEGEGVPEAWEEQVSELTGRLPDQVGEAPVPREAVSPDKQPRATPEDLLHGIVVTRAGEPIAGAEVELQRREGQGFAIMDITGSVDVVDRTRSARDGTFSLSVQPLRQLALRVDAEGYGPELLFACFGGQFHRVVLEPTGAIEGFVTSSEDHRPLEGVGVAVLRANLVPALSQVVAWDTMVEVETDARGYYRADGLPYTGLQVLVLPPQGIPPPTWLEVVLQPGEVVRKDFEVEPGGLLSGTVRDATTWLPVAAAEVFDDPWSMRSVHTDVLGRFELAGAEGAIRVRASGYAQAMVQVGSDRRAARSVDVELHRGGAVAGRVVDASGLAVAGAYVAGVAHGEGMTLQREWLATRSGSEGGFRIEDLSPDLSHYLLVRHPGSGTAAYDIPPIQPGVTREIGDLVLHEGAAIRGQVLSQTGEAIPGAFVELRGTNADYFTLTAEEDGGAELPSLDGTVRKTTTDDAGVFRFGDLAPGSYTVTVRLDFRGFALLTPGTSPAAGTARTLSNRKSIPAVIEDRGQVLDDLELRFDLGLSISGTVRDPTGEVPRVFLAMLDRGYFKPFYNTDGAFELHGLAEGTYTVMAQVWSAEDTWARGVVRDVPAGTSGVEVVFRPFAWIEGTVLDASGEPAAGVTVYGVSEYLGTRSPGERLRTGTDGRFRMRVGEGDLVEVHAVPPGEGNAEIEPPDLRDEVLVPGVPAGTTDLVIRMK